MKKSTKAFITAALCIMLSSCSAQQHETVYIGTTGTASSDINDNLFSERDLNGSYADYKDIVLKDGETAVCEGADVSGNTVTITQEGTYRISGRLTDGQIVIDCGGGKVQIVLDNAYISCVGNAAVYIKQADKVLITTAENSINRIASTGEFSKDEKADGAIFSKSDITFNGSGTLETESTSHAAVSKGSIKITGGKYEITAAKKGISAKENIIIGSSIINISSKGHAVCSKNDESEKSGIIITDGCDLNVTTDDDGLHSSGVIEINSGKVSISAADDGIHSDTETDISGGEVAVIKSKEGIEGKKVNISGGVIDITSSDDGINASGGKDGSGSDDGWGKGGSETDENALIDISGGTININADGDGIDSNGKLAVSGGTVYVSGPTNAGNGALDYGTEAVITGGTVIAAGSTGMAVNFGKNSTQGSMLCCFDNAVSAGTKITIKDPNGNILAEYEPMKKYQCAVISTPDIKIGDTYTITAGSETKTIEMQSVIFGEENGFGFGGPGRNDFKDNNKFDRRHDMNDGKPPELPEFDRRDFEI